MKKRFQYAYVLIISAITSDTIDIKVKIINGLPKTVLV